MAESDVDMEVAGSSEPFSFNLLEIIKKAQSIHGLKQQDYGRYRHYCARRLRRLYKALNFLHGGKKRFEGRTISVDTVTDVRYLHILLVDAERAWAYAMELKQDVSSEPRKRVHLLHRLSKAAKVANELAQICQKKTDSRTALEAEAYCSWMAASVHFEREDNWEAALAKFTRTRTVYEQLSKVGDMEQQALCRERVEEIEPSIRYCQYNLKRSSQTKVADFFDVNDTSGNELLQSKLESVLAAERAKQAESMLEVSWQGGVLAVRSSSTRVCILNAQALEAQVAQLPLEKTEKKMGLYDKIFMAYNDARKSIRDDMSLAMQGEGAAASLAELQRLDAAVSTMLVQQTIARNKMMVAQAQASLERHQQLQEDAARARDAAAAPRAKGEKQVRPEDLVRLYDTLVSNLAELADSSTSSSTGATEAAAEALAAECSAQEDAMRAARCLYLSQAHSAQGSAPQAYALLEKLKEYANRAVEKERARGPAGVAALASLQELLARASAQQSRLHAATASEALADEQALKKGMDGMELEGAEGAGKKAAWLMESLDEFKAFAGKQGKGGPRLQQIPPGFTPVPYKPIVLDTALNAVQFPSLEGRKAVAKGVIGRAGRAVSGIFSGWGRKS